MELCEMRWQGASCRFAIYAGGNIFNINALKKYRLELCKVFCSDKVDHSVGDTELNHAVLNRENGIKVSVSCHYQNKGTQLGGSGFAIIFWRLGWWHH